MSGDMMDTLKGLLGDDADEKISAVMSALGKGTQEEKSNAEIEPREESNAEKKMQDKSGINEESLQYIGQFKNMVDSMGRANDARSRLLISLKPYMRTSRQKSIDRAIRLLNISRLSGIFKL